MAQRSCQLYRQESALSLGGAGKVLSGPVNAYERFAVAQPARERHLQHVSEGQPVDLEDLVLLRALRERGELRGEEQMNDFCKNAGRAQVIPERLPGAGRHAGFFFELATRGVERRLAIVDLA